MKIISDYMTKNIVYVGSEDTVLEAVDIMRKKGIGAVLINGKNEKLVGIFTERDLLTRVNLYDPQDLQMVKVQDVMTKRVKTVAFDEPYVGVIKKMQKNGIRHMPVAQNGTIIGIVSLRDVMRQYEKNLEIQLKESQTQLLENLNEIKKSEERFRTIFNNSSVAIIVSDQKDRIITWNPLAADLICIKSDSPSKSMKTLFTKGEWDNICPIHRDKERMNRHVETKIINENGAPIDVEASVSILHDEKNSFIGAITILKDISENKRIALKLQKSRKEIEDIRFSLDEHAVVSIADAKGKIIYANDKFCEVSQFSREELMGQDHRIVNSGYHSKAFFTDLWETIQSGNVWKGEVRNKAKDGSFYWMDTTIVPFLDEHDVPYQYVSIRTNVSQRKQREEELESLNKDLAANEKALRMLFEEKEKEHKKLLETEKKLIQSEKMATMGTMAAGFAHEIKNPLAIILQSMEKIERNLTSKNDDKSLPFVNIVKSATDRANTVVNNILRYSRASSVEESLINIYDVIDGAVELMVDSGNAQNVEITRDYDEANYPVLGDTIMLQQVFMDLMTNAMQAMPDGGQINIQVRFNPATKKSDEIGNYVIHVKDTGTGIHSDDIKRIFDPFFTTKEEGKGTGLGLNTVYLIVQKHRGTVDVESKVGKGTNFIITLPADKQPSQIKKGGDDYGRQN